MIPLFHTLLAAILGSGGGAAQAQQPRIPLVTYGANALAQSGGGVKSSSNKELKNVQQQKVNTTTKVTNSNDKDIKGAGKYNSAGKYNNAGKMNKDTSAQKTTVIK